MSDSPVGLCFDMRCQYPEPHRHGFACDNPCPCAGRGPQTVPLPDDASATCDWGRCDRPSVAGRIAKDDLVLPVCSWHAGWDDYEGDTVTDLGDPYEGADPRLAWMLRVLSDEFGMLGVMETQQAAYYYANTKGRIDHRLGPQSDEAPEPDEPHDHGYMGRPRVCATCGQEQPAVDQLKEFIAANDPTVSETQRKARELGLKIDFELVTTSPLDEHDDDAPAFEPMTDEAKREYQEGLTKDWDTLESAVYVALGAASACWEHPEGAGVFDDQRAVLVAQSLVKWVEDRLRLLGRAGGG